jgi:hypothetical protein
VKCRSNLLRVYSIFHASSGVYVDCAVLLDSGPFLKCSSASSDHNSFDIYLSPPFDLHLLLLSNHRRPFITARTFPAYARLVSSLGSTQLDSRRGKKGRKAFFTHELHGAETDFSPSSCRPMNNLPIHFVFIPPDGHAQGAPIINSRRSFCCC